MNFFYSIFAIVALLISSSSSFSFVGNKFYLFRRCLLDAGLDSKDIVRRGPSLKYRHLNYQWQLLPPRKKPLAFVLVRNEEDVVGTVRCGRKLNVRLIPKGGGHSLEKYSFGSRSDVVVDLRYLKRILIDKSAMKVTVGPGWLIGPLDAKLYQTGEVITTLGLCPTVGLSGLATGGGLGAFSRLYGLTTDNILEANIVTADGALLRTNSTSNSDLFWALRGGVGSSFGIVTQFDLKIYPAPPLAFYGYLEYNISKFIEVFDAWQEHASTAPKTITGIMEIQSGEIVVYFMDPSGTSQEFDIIANKFPAGGKIVRKTVSYPEFLLFSSTTLAAQKFQPGTKLETLRDYNKINRETAAKIYQKRKSFFINNKIGTYAIRILKSHIDNMPSSVDLSFEAYGGAINEVPENETAFVHRKSLYNLKLNHKTQYPSPAANIIGVYWVEKFFELGELIFQHNETYQNYVDAELPNYLERYYGSNLQRLVEVKKNTIPETTFRTHSQFHLDFKFHVFKIIRLHYNLLI